MTANSVTSECRTLLFITSVLPRGFTSLNLLFPLAPGTGDIDVGSDAIACAFETTRSQISEETFDGGSRDVTLHLELLAMVVSSSLSFEAASFILAHITFLICLSLLNRHFGPHG